MLNIAQIIGLIKKFGGGTGTGGGMPEGGAPNQQLVTDPSGNPVWEDRTHYEEPGPSGVHYDSPEGLESVYLDDGSFYNGTYYKISDYFIDPTKIVFDANEKSVPLYGGSSSSIANAESPCWFIHYAGGIPLVIATSSTDALLENSYFSGCYPGMTVPSPGIWAIYPTPDGYGNGPWLSFDYTGEGGKIHPLDPKFLPEEALKGVVVGFANKSSYNTRILETASGCATSAQLIDAAYNGRMTAIILSYSNQRGVLWFSGFGTFSGAEVLSYTGIIYDPDELQDGNITNYTTETWVLPVAPESIGFPADALLDLGLGIGTEDFAFLANDNDFGGANTFRSITIPSGGSLTIKEGATVNDEAGILGGGISSVEDAVPDENGNVAFPVIESMSAQKSAMYELTRQRFNGEWEDDQMYWQEKTHYKGSSEMFSWDGDSTGLSETQYTQMYMRYCGPFADYNFTAEDVVGKTMYGHTYVENGYIVEADDIISVGAESKIVYGGWDGQAPIVFVGEGDVGVKIELGSNEKFTSANKCTFPASGIWIGKYYNSPGVKSIREEWADKQLDEMFIPDTIQRVGRDVILTDSANAKWRLLVSTDGTLSTEAVT